MNYSISHIEETERLYRFVSFYDLYDILFNGRLRFSKLSTFDDRNEGMGHILQFQDEIIFRHQHLKKDKILEAHRYALHNHYLSCWTREKDMVATWALYSPHYDSFRISTTAGKLCEALNKLAEDTSWTKEIEVPDTRKLVSWYCVLQSVDYVDFFSVRDKIRKRYQEFATYTSSMYAQDNTYYFKEDGFLKDYLEFREQKLIEKDGIFLKDRSYSHEAEVRAVLYCGIRNNLAKEEWLKPENIMRNLWGVAGVDELPDYIYGKVPESFLLDICFDPRMPKYKRQIIEQVLEGKKPSIAESKSFGYALEQDSFESDLDGKPIKV